MVDVEWFDACDGKCLQVCSVTSQQTIPITVNVSRAIKDKIGVFTEFKYVYITKSVLFRFKCFLACNLSKFIRYHELCPSSGRIDVIFV